MNHPLEANRLRFADALPETQEAELLALDPLPPPAAAAAPVLEGRPNPLLQVRTQIQVCVGEACISVEELLSARQGHGIALDRKVDQVVDVLLEGQVVARGQLVAVGDVFGVRITELPLPLTA